MPFNYTLDKVSKLGDNDETYGQRYWCESPDEDKPLCFNTKEDIELTEDSGPISITAEERVEKQSGKGTIYYQLKKVKVSGSQGRGDVPASPPVTKGSENPQDAAVIPQLDRIEKQLSLLLEGINDLKGFGSEDEGI